MIDIKILNKNPNFGIYFIFHSLFLLILCASCGRFESHNFMQKEEDPKENETDYITKDDIAYKSFADLYIKHTQKKIRLLKSIEERDIVLFLGKTGSGKSSLINYLVEKELIVNEDCEIYLADSSDTSAMMIGSGSESVTTEPKAIMYDDLCLCDLPGLEDTNGLGIDLLNTDFFEFLVKNSRRISLVFVASRADIDSTRGSAIISFKGIIENLMPGLSIMDCSCLVITKSDISSLDDQIEYLKKKIEKESFYYINQWKEKDQVFMMLRPQESEIGEIYNHNDTREKLISIIKKVKGSSIKNVNRKALLKNIAPYKIEELLNRIILEYKNKSEEYAYKEGREMKNNEALKLNFHEWLRDKYIIDAQLNEHKRLFTQDIVVDLLKNFDSYIYDRSIDKLQNSYNHKSRSLDLEKLHIPLEAYLNEIKTLSSNLKVERREIHNHYTCQLI
jgi:energy-coupling factor transporter ATP-binding protein EcfA2